MTIKKNINNRDSHTSENYRCAMEAMMTCCEFLLFTVTHQMIVHTVAIMFFTIICENLRRRYVPCICPHMERAQGRQNATNALQSLPQTFRKYGELNPRTTEGGGYHPLCFSNAIFFPRKFFRNASVYLWATHFHIFWCINFINIMLLCESVLKKWSVLGGYHPLDLSS